MKKILVIGASNSKKSINQVFANYVGTQLEGVDLLMFDADLMDMPIYSQHEEEANGIPRKATQFNELIASSDGVVLSMAEHNGLPTAAFKNLTDWTSRIGQKYWANKPLFLAAVSPGGRGGANVLNTMKNLLPHFGAQVIVDYSLPNYYDNFKEEGIVDSTLNSDLAEKIKTFQSSL